MTADVLVVGGEVVGPTAAMEVAQTGARVVIVDAAQNAAIVLDRTPPADPAPRNPARYARLSA